MLEYFLVPNVFPSSSRKVPQDVPNSTKLLFIVYALAKFELSSYINYKVEPKESTFVLLFMLWNKCFGAMH